MEVTVFIHFTYNDTLITPLILFISALEVYFILACVCLQNNLKSCVWILIKISGKDDNDTRKDDYYHCGDQDHCLDPLFLTDF